MTITGSNTTNFGFQKLGPNDSAGYSTINEVVDGVDTILNASDRLIKAGQTPTAAYVITGDGVDWIAGLVVTNSITDLNVTTGKLAANAVTGAKIESSVALPGAPTVVTANGSYQQSSNTSRVATIQYVNDAAASLTAGTAYVVGGDLSGTTGAATIVAGAVTYAKLGNTAKTYSPVSISSSTTLAVGTHDTTTTASIPLVQVTAAATISIPTGGVTGSVINIFSTTASTVTIQPVSSSVTINGSTSATYTVGAQYSIVSLICYAANTWIITGDYI